MKQRSVSKSVAGDMARTALAIVSFALLAGCATWTGTVGGTATEKDLETVPLTQQLVSSKFKLDTPDGWVAKEVPETQYKQESMMGLFSHPEKGATLAVYIPKGAVTVAATRKKIDHYAELLLPGAKVSDGPFSFGSTAMSPMYIRYAGAAYRQGEVVKRQVYGGWNIARTFVGYTMLMVVDDEHADWGKHQFISIMKGF